MGRSALPEGSSLRFFCENTEYRKEEKRKMTAERKNKGYIYQQNNT